MPDDVGELVLNHVPEHIVVIKAPDRARITLALVRAADDRFLEVGYDTITFFTEPVLTYRIVGWDRGALEIVRCIEEEKDACTSRHDLPDEDLS